jgi:hypothetical protein
MDMLTTKEALDVLRKRGFDVPYPTIALWVRTGKFNGAELDETNSRGPVWLIPRESVENFQPPERGRPPKAAAKTSKKGSRK